MLRDILHYPPVIGPEVQSKRKVNGNSQFPSNTSNIFGFEDFVTSPQLVRRVAVQQMYEFCPKSIQNSNQKLERYCALVSTIISHCDIVYENLRELRTSIDERRNYPYAIMAYFHDFGKISGPQNHEKRSANFLKRHYPNVDEVLLDAIRRHTFLGKLDSRYDHLLFMADKLAALHPKQQELKYQKLQDLQKVKDYVEQKRKRLHRVLELCPYKDICESARNLEQRLIQEHA
jgi:hypothetical protein